MEYLYLSETLCLSMLLKAEGWKMYATTKDVRLGQNADSSYAINLHLHIWVAIWITKVGKMWSPGGVLSIPFHDHRVLVKSFSKRERRLGFLPAVQVVWLLSTEPVWERSPDVCPAVSMVSNLP
jgi:hypothetical protein